MKAVLLVNLGSPDSPSVSDVRKYLREFLMDGRVLDINPIARFCIVNFAILPSRPKQSAEAYHKIWTPAGSPLVVTSRTVQTKLQQRLDIPVELAMRYQSPSIPDAIQRLAQKGVDDLLLIPLFPHYAMSSFETAVERVKEVAAKISPRMRIHVQPPYFDHPDYINALVASAQDYLNQGFDHLLFSFHGLPERQIRKSDPTDCHCLTTQNCCETPSPAHATCYRAQCFKTVAAFVHKTGLPKEKYSVAFQSRLGRDPWLKPYTDLELPKLAQRGIKKMFVICPAFVADCLETLEEIGIRARETFVEAGGKELALIPCMNEHPLWLDALEKMIRAFTNPAQQSAATPKYEPITGELLEVLKGDCQDVVDYAAKNFRVDLPFNDESIMWLTSFIEEQRGKMNPETRRSWSVRIGIYLGFAIIERYGGEWVETEGNNPAIRFSTGAMAFPVTKTSKQFENGPFDNIHVLYRNVGRLLHGDVGQQIPPNARDLDAPTASAS